MNTKGVAIVAILLFLTFLIERGLNPVWGVTAAFLILLSL